MCSLVIQSSAHSNRELTYHWKFGNRSRLNFVQGLEYQDRMTPDIRLLGYRFRSATSQKEKASAVAFDQVFFKFISIIFFVKNIWEYDR